MKISQILRIIFKIFGLCIAGSILLVIFLAFRPFYQANQVKIGMSKTQVLAIHASRINHIKTVPNLDDFCPQPPMFTDVCQFNQRRQANYFLIISIGIDTRQIIGFDKNDKVIYEMIGDT